MPRICTKEELRSIYGPAKEKVLEEKPGAIEPSSERFIELSPFHIISSCNAEGMHDNSPRGGHSGFVKTQDHKTLLIPDFPGNNRLDTLENIIENGKVGLIFFIPGIDETLRINGKAYLSTDESVMNLFSEYKKPPKLAIVVQVESVHRHCANALKTSQLWSSEKFVSSSALAV